MKIVFLWLLSFCLLLQNICAQNIGIGTNIPSPNALLDVRSTTKGTKLTSMTTAQRKAIPVTSADAGLLVFDLNKSTLYLYDGFNWRPFLFKSEKELDPVVRPAGDGTPNDSFGISVAIHGEYVIVGASKHLAAGGLLEAGHAYIFKLENGTWVQQVKLSCPDEAGHSMFGTSVALHGNYAMMGAPGINSAYVFVRSGTSWTQQAKLTPADISAFDFFGASVAINGTCVAVGAPGDDSPGMSDHGSVYVYTLSGASWIQRNKLTPADVSAGDDFGTSVSVDGDNILVGAPNDDAVGTIESKEGSAFLFTKSPFALTWIQAGKLIADDAATSDKFGTAVAIKADLMLIGAPNKNNSVPGTPAGRGCAYIFVNNSGTWLIKDHLRLPDYSNDINEMYFGISVALTDSFATIGSSVINEVFGGTPTCAAYLFNISRYAPGSAVLLLNRRRVDHISETFGFGVSVAIHAYNWIIGAFGWSNEKGTVHFLNFE
jgi:hypothetical protein